MQPALSQVYQQTSESETLQQLPSSSQYGYDLSEDHDLPANHGGQPDPGRPEGVPSGLSLAGDNHASGSPANADTEDDQEGHVSGLRRSPPPATPPRNRIAEYERSVSGTSTPAFGGMRFEVVKQPRKPGDTSCPIAKLPNGG
jgi:hypothetical protein